MRTRLNKPAQIKVWDTKKRQEIELLYNVFRYDMKLSNLLFNATKSEKKAKEELANLPF